MESIGFIQWCFEHLNYWTITILMTLESSVFPVPSELVVPPAAYHCAATGELNMMLILLFSTLGAMLGATLNYTVSLWVGKPLVHKFAGSRIGHFLGLSVEKIEKAEGYFNKHGKVSTLVGRFIPVIRHLISIPAGLARMNYGSFLLFTGIGAGLWNVCLLLMGWYLEKMIPEDQLFETVSKYSHEIGYGILAIVIIVIAIMLIKKRSGKNQ